MRAAEETDIQPAFPVDPVVQNLLKASPEQDHLNQALTLELVTLLGLSAAGVPLLDRALDIQRLLTKIPVDIQKEAGGV